MTDSLPSAMVEPRSEKPVTGGSIPPTGTIKLSPELIVFMKDFFDKEGHHQILACTKNWKETDLVFPAPPICYFDQRRVPLGTPTLRGLWLQIVWYFQDAFSDLRQNLKEV